MCIYGLNFFFCFIFLYIVSRSTYVGVVAQCVMCFTSIIKFNECCSSLNEFFACLCVHVSVYFDYFFYLYFILLCQSACSVASYRFIVYYIYYMIDCHHYFQQIVFGAANQTLARASYSFFGAAFSSTVSNSFTNIKVIKINQMVYKKQYAFASWPNGFFFSNNCLIYNGQIFSLFLINKTKTAIHRKIFIKKNQNLKISK